MESATATATPSAIATGNESSCSCPDSLPTAVIDVDRIVKGLNCANTECRDKLEAMAATCWVQEPPPDGSACASARAALVECLSKASARNTEEKEENSSPSTVINADIVN